MKETEKEQGKKEQQQPKDDKCWICGNTDLEDGGFFSDKDLWLCKGCKDRNFSTEGKDDKDSDLKDIIATLKDWNPYPADVFLPKTSDQWKAFHKALNEAGIMADGYLGCVARDAYNLALDKVLEALDEKDKGVR